MDKELLHLLEKISSYSDDDLIGIINNGSTNFRPEVIELAKAVIIRRGCSLNKRGQVIKNKKAKPSASPAIKDDNAAFNDESLQGHANQAGELNRLLASVFCPRCAMKLDYVGTRRLHEEKSLAALGELGEMYKNGSHEFLDVYICNRCGHAEFFVDGVGDDLRPY